MEYIYNILTNKKSFYIVIQDNALKITIHLIKYHIANKNGVNASKYAKNIFMLCICDFVYII